LRERAVLYAKATEDYHTLLTLNLKT
jgi:hypothetical protein